MAVNAANRTLLMDKKGLYFQLLLLLALSCTPSAQTLAADPGASRLAMADAMLSMMDAMGLFGRSSESNDRSGSSRRWTSLTPSTDGVNRRGGATPWSGFPSRYPPPPRWIDDRTMLVPLNGEWMSENGERLQVHGSRFRLLAGPGREVEGVLYLRNNLLALHSPRHDRTWTYEYAEHRGHLALRDTQGRLYLYTRINPHPGRFREQSRSNATPRSGNRDWARSPGAGVLRRRY